MKNYTPLRKATTNAKNLEGTLMNYKCRKATMKYEEFHKIQTVHFLLTNGHIDFMKVSGDDAIICISGIAGLLSYSEEQEVNTHGKTTRGERF